MTTGEMVKAAQTRAPRRDASRFAAHETSVSPGSAAPASSARRAPRSTPLPARGEPYVWLTGAGLATAILMILGLLVLVVFNGSRTFWPGPLLEVTLLDGSRVLGEVSREERYRPTGAEITAMSPAARARVLAADGWSSRRLFRTGNYDLYGDDFRWITAAQVAAERRPHDAWMIERQEWGPALGFPKAITKDGAVVAEGADAVARVFASLHERSLATASRIRKLERRDIGDINYQAERARLEVRAEAIGSGDGSPRHQEAAARGAARQEALRGSFERIQSEIGALRGENVRHRLVVTDATGRLISESPGSPDTPLQLAQVVRAYPANALGLTGDLRVYLSRWREYLTAEPREANTEGGVLPAIFGTLMMTVMMTVVVGPFGVMAALYLREYARQGPLVSAVRIAVNNLAGVPSIVFGVFGLGFFCYALGGSLDALLHPERLPAPTFGTGGILWASLTLALLTVPVVIVATEEALAAVPRSLREGSFACGASRWQTIRRIVMPRATPGIMTGLILAMARGAGEVAPLMLTGVVKMAPELPFDGHFPWFHLERSFMHLGFHIYDVGFQSRNSEAGKPMVYTTTLLLIVMIMVLNLAAIALRSRLRRRFLSDHF